MQIQRTKLQEFETNKSEGLKVLLPFYLYILDKRITQQLRSILKENTE